MYLFNHSRQRQIVGQTAEQHHRRVRVRVDQTGKDDLIRWRRSSRDHGTGRPMFSAVSTATMSVPSMATAPLAITRLAASTVTTVPPVTTSETWRGGVLGRHAAARARDDGRRNGKKPDAHRGILRTISPVPLHVITHPLVHDALMELRDARTAPPAFRRAANRISVLLAAEALRDAALVGGHGDDAAGPGGGSRRTHRCRRRARSASRARDARRRAGTPAGGPRRAHRAAARRGDRDRVRGTTRSFRHICRRATC